MGSLQNRVDLNMKVYGKDIVDFYKNNSIFMVDKYTKSDDMCTSLSIRDIVPGRFYFFHYEDPSNWMRYSPVFVVDYRKVGQDYNEEKTFPIQLKDDALILFKNYLSKVINNTD